MQRGIQELLALGSGVCTELVAQDVYLFNAEYGRLTEYQTHSEVEEGQLPPGPKCAVGSVLLADHPRKYWRIHARLDS